jgi:protein-S-isoprenylcysteine O-methyltransferase Ste14
VLSSIAIDLAIILSQHFGAPFRGPLDALLRGQSAVDTCTVTPLFLVGWAATVISGLLRIQCYRALGHMFTFEISLRENHRLITSGPYAYVRHPSYTAVTFGVPGTLLLHFGPGSWFKEAGWLATRGGWTYAVFWVLMECFVLVSIVTRSQREDELLRKAFGEKWDAWATRVPYVPHSSSYYCTISIKSSPLCDGDMPDVLLL